MQYRDLFTIPGTISLQAWSLLGRLQVGAFQLALVLYGAAQFGSYAVGGTSVAVALLAVAATSPIKGRLIDRYGFSRVLTPMMIISVGFLALTLLSDSELGFLVGSLGLGLTRSNVTTYMRAAWRHLYNEDEQLQHLASSLEASIAPMTFLIGPVLVGAVISATGVPASGLILIMGLATIGTLGFAWHPLSRGLTREPSQLKASLGHLTSLLIGCTLITATLGSLDVAVPAIADDALLAGITIAMISVGGVFGGYFYGKRVKPGTAIRSLPWQCLWFSLSAALVALPWPKELLVLFVVPVGVIYGCFVASAQSAILADVPKSRATEALSWWAVTSGSGIALGSFYTGQLADRDPHAGIWISVGLGLVALGCMVYFRRVVRDG